MKKIIFVFFSALLLSHEASAFLFGLFEGGRNSYTEYLDKSVYQTNTGIGVNDLMVYEEQVAATFRSVLEKNASASQAMATAQKEEFDLQLLYDLNLQSAAVWQQMVSCFGDLQQPSSVLQARQAYVDSAVKKSSYICGGDKARGAQISEELQLLHVNIKNWVESSGAKERLMRFSISNVSLPALHPLMGQVLVELRSYYSQDGRKIMFGSRGVEQFFTGGELNFSVDTLACKDGFKQKINCEELVKVGDGFSFLSKLLSTTRKSCSSFGLWPNATIYLYSGTALGGDGFTTHPHFSAYLKQESTYEYFEYKGISYLYSVYYSDVEGSNQLGLMGEMPRPEDYDYSLLNQAPLPYVRGMATGLVPELRIQMKIDYDKKYTSTLNPLSECWIGANTVVEGIKGGGQARWQARTVQANAHIDIYADFFKIYSGIK